MMLDVGPPLARLKEQAIDRNGRPIECVRARLAFVRNPDQSDVAVSLGEV